MTDDLACRVECAEAMARYAIALDRASNSEAADFFAEDGLLVLPDRELRGDEVRIFIEARPPSIATHHVLSNIVITPTGSDAAEGEAYVQAFRTARAEPDTLPRELPVSPHGVGLWKIEFRRYGGSWKFTRWQADTLMVPAK